VTIPALRLNTSVLQRPLYDNAQVLSFPNWLADNKRALIRWWWDCDVALRVAGGPAAAADDEFEQFCRCQHDRELAKVTQ
jgi:hypothetical protein